jgi:hypothetical protein
MPSNNRAQPEVQESAYYLDPKPDGSDLSDVLYAFVPRNLAKAPPTWQRTLHEQILELYGFVLNADISDIADKKNRLKWLVDFYSFACVQLPATSAAPPSAGDTTRRLEDFKKRLWKDLFEDLAGRVGQHRVWILCTCLFLGLLGAGLVAGISAINLPPQTTVGNYILVAAASMAGLFVSDLRLKSLAGAAEYEALRQRFGSPPYARIIGTSFVAVVAALAVSSEVVKITLGKWSSSNIPHDTSIALLVGFVAGIPGSRVVTRFWKWVSGD